MLALHEYVSAITTIISNYRVRELPYPLDDEHVLRWLKQFDKNIRYTIAKEVFYILSRNYIKEERITSFLTQVVEYIEKNDNLDRVAFINLQKKGNSQDIFCGIIVSICKNLFEKQCHIINNREELNGYFAYVYVDDGLYTGGHIKDDIIPLISTLLEGSKLYIFYMVVYNNAYNHYRGLVMKEAQKRNITVIFKIEQEKNNIRNIESENIDFIWPERPDTNNDLINQYERKLKQTGKAHYIYDWQSSSERKKGIFSDYNSRTIVEKAFLEEGIKIANKIDKTIFRPLGITNIPSFGFGSVYVTDYNISNTCPLVLWWGSVKGNKDNDDPINCWYLLLPRRTNQMTFEEICKYENDFSLNRYKKELWTVYKLAQDESDNHKKTRITRGKTEGNVVGIFDIKLDENVNLRRRSDLLNYMNGLDMDTIKVIQTVMYIGRDYRYPSHLDEEWDAIYEPLSEEPDFHTSEKKMTVDNPDEIFLAWMDYLEMEKEWNDKDIEIDQIYQKAPLAEYLHRAFDILGLKDDVLL